MVDFRTVNCGRIDLLVAEHSHEHRNAPEAGARFGAYAAALATSRARDTAAWTCSAGSIGSTPCPESRFASGDGKCINAALCTAMESRATQTFRAGFEA